MVNLKQEDQHHCTDICKHQRFDVNGSDILYHELSHRVCHSAFTALLETHWTVCTCQIIHYFLSNQFTSSCHLR